MLVNNMHIPNKPPCHTVMRGSPPLQDSNASTNGASPVKSEWRSSIAHQPSMASPGAAAAAGFGFDGGSGPATTSSASGGG
mmetsp:Transcript_75019/g.149032  ORF Transcript_75019/g.149032 Transcript_75019/m.149032 type:complete len:81 (+) Transcript_75019:196-438(+)